MKIVDKLYFYISLFDTRNNCLNILLTSANEIYIKGETKNNNIDLTKEIFLWAVKWVLYT